MSLWNFTIQDNSPIISYAPYADGALAAGWQPWYSESGFLKEGGQGGEGTSYHTTAFSGASFHLEFHGTGVDLYGTGNSSYEITIDRVAQKIGDVADGLLFHASDLKDDAHNVTLTVKPSKKTEQLTFDRAVVFAPVQQIPTAVFYDNSDSKVLTYTGSWDEITAEGIPNASVTHPFAQTKSGGSKVSMQFSGAVGCAIHGMVNWGDWVYSVDLDGKTAEYNGSTYWKVPDALRYFQAGLDPKKTHTLTLANPSDQMALSLSSITLYKLGDKVSISSASQIKSASDSASSSHMSTSASVTSSSVTSSSVTSSGSGASDTSSAADAGPSPYDVV
ncbi:hypothetical protein C8J57DRAFT_490226 [Mycena rebaudengoi]|nr:hypothetical protein C8J57DRAFT_490226 [Mycena rebaudengoi]